ncbi:hypothetical protein DZC72_02945 [Maribacter algicola]|uniref:Uncharacterized protein n=1 Tax=Maribacter algicola TaxID=2498892 RepID=A0A3R8S0Y7_9FLAO|nr:hypothetical protein [Maribacter algicola]RRQ49575.1 hypothetical protein DZC72_02945 [Maribacter algicola]
MKLKIALPILLLLSCGQGNKEIKPLEQHKGQRQTDSPTTKEDHWETQTLSNEKGVKEISIQNLYKAMEDKDEEEFLRQFPEDFQQFQSYFGWNMQDDAPHELYEHSVHYIEYLFYLLRTNKYPSYEKKIIAICKNGLWEADGINYFQHHVLEYIIQNEKYYLINELDDETSKSVLFFLFDGPHPKFDAEFASHLSPSKKGILEELFETGFYDHNENPDPFPDEENNVTYTLSDYVENEHFFIRDIDINNDGTPDKIISAEKYQGDELFLFLKKGNEYQFTLKTTNFSEDGGNQIVDVIADEGGFVVKTAFMDGGLLEADYHIAFKNNAWVLTHTVYSTQSSNQEDAFIYVCNVVQELNLEDADFFESLEGMPDETQRERLCTKEKMN